jgi:REP element-mobilizing transposase RayT
MIRGIEKGRIVKDDEDRARFVSRMGTLAKQTGTAIYAWALLSNHAHILLRSGQSGMAVLMRRLLTGYAVAYNRRHKRYGHVFQNRYKSIVCEEDPYFQRLVCYIHLNPLRSGLVHSLEELDSYPWCGHGVVMKQSCNDWQDQEYVLEYFGKTEGRARKAYRQCLQEQSRKERQPELTGGGLIRSMGGWSVVKGKRKQGEWEQGDERILGSSVFVQEVLKHTEESVKHQIGFRETGKRVEKELEKVCRESGVTVELLQTGSRIQPLPKLRKKIAGKFVKEYGMTLAETARQLGVSTSAVARIIQRD